MSTKESAITEPSTSIDKSKEADKPPETTLDVQAYFVEDELLFQHVEMDLDSTLSIKNVVEGVCRRLFTSKFEERLTAGGYEIPAKWFDAVTVELYDEEEKTFSALSVIFI